MVSVSSLCKQFWLAFKLASYKTLICSPPLSQPRPLIQNQTLQSRCSLCEEWGMGGQQEIKNEILLVVFLWFSISITIFRILRTELSWHQLALLYPRQWTNISVFIWRFGLLILPLVHFTLDPGKCLWSNRWTEKFWAPSQDQIKLVLDPEQMQFSAFATLLSWRLKVDASGHKVATKWGDYDMLLCDRRQHKEEGLLQQFSYDSLCKQTDQYR